MTVMLAERPAAAVRVPTSEKLDYCRALAASGLLPAQYRQQPANLLYAVEFADSLGLHPMVAITGVHVIEGKPSASSALISALVRRAGHKLRVRGDATRAVAQVIRADDPEYVFEVVFTMDDADRAGLLGKKVWKQYPASMLKARAISAVARDACEEALFGVHYTPEELGADVDDEGNPVGETGFVRQQPQVQDAWQQATPAPAAEPVQKTPRETAMQPAADVPQESTTPAGRDYLAEAYAAPDAATVRRIWQDAKAEGAVPEYLAQIAEVGREKAFIEANPPEALQTAATPQAPAPGPETLPGAPDSRADAVTALYAAGEACGMSQVETRQVLAQETRHTVADATPAELARVTADLRAAAGGAR